MEIHILLKRLLFSSILFFFFHFVYSLEKVKITENDIECINCKNVIETVDYFRHSVNTENLLKFLEKKCATNPSKICNTIETKNNVSFYFKKLLLASNIIINKKFFLA